MNALTIYALAIAPYAIRTEHADCGEPCDLPSCLDGPWSAEAIDRLHRLPDGNAA